jgi:hypothetical protein
MIRKNRKKIEVKINRPYSMSRTTNNAMDPQILGAWTYGYAVISCLYHTVGDGNSS